MIPVEVVLSSLKTGPPIAVSATSGLEGIY